MHVFVEKPLSNSINDLDQLKNIVNTKNKILQVGFMMRFHPHILAIKKIIKERSFGELLNSESHWGSYLPAWHHWENYKEGYAAKKSLGGGVALTLCHDIDLALWLSGKKLSNHTTILTHVAALDIEVESIADISLKFEDGSSAQVHLNYLDNPPIRWYKWKFEKATVHFSYFENTLKIHRSEAPDKSETIVLKEFERNELFIKEVNSFFESINHISDTSAFSLLQIEESELIINLCNDK